jgi:hypothetical protein
VVAVVLLFELPSLVGAPVLLPVDVEGLVAVDVAEVVPVEAWVLEEESTVELTGVSHRIGFAAGSENWPFVQQLPCWKMLVPTTLQQ